MKILVTGMGAVSAIGNDVSGNFTSLKNSITGISLLEGIEDIRKPFVGGQVKRSNDELRDIFSIAKGENIHRSTLLGLVAAKEAWGNRSPDPQLRTGIIFGNSVRGVDLNVEVFSKAWKNGAAPKIDCRKTHDSGFGTDFIAKRVGIKDYKATISTACSSSANAILVGARLIKANMLDRVLVGGAEAISNYTINGFDSLRLYDPDPCKPFDENRKGLNLGEAGAFLVLESERSAEATGQIKLGELVGWANTCDSYHITASSPEGKGAELAISNALKMANLSPGSIDYINAHGTGTPNNDLSESNALKKIFGNKIPPFSSTKSFTGHTLAAAGGIEAVFSILAIQNNIIFSNLNYVSPMKENPLCPEKKVIENKIIKTVISNSFGFGGNCTELIFSE